jgi:hypothetical protein
MQAARGDRQGALEVAQQLARALADPYPPLWPVTTRTKDQKVAVMALNDTMQPARDRKVGLDERPRTRRHRVAS